MSSNHKLATLCYVYHNEKILLLHRVKKVNDMHEGKYIGIGGKMESYENPRECLLREIDEEAGIKPLDLTLRSIIYFKEEGNLNLHPALNYLVFVYRATEFEGEIQPSNEGNLVWKTIEEFHQLTLWEGDKIFVPKLIFENAFFEATFIYTPEEKLVSYSIN
jgi:8-oxo-dGTP diphosphatase